MKRYLLLPLTSVILSIASAPQSNSQPSPDSFPLQITIESSFAEKSAEIAASVAKGNALGAAPPTFVVFHGKINGEDHWILSCRNENPLSERNPCTDLPHGDYRGRWIHDHNLIELVDNPSNPSLVRFVIVSANQKSAPLPDDQIYQLPVFDFTVDYPAGKSAKDYPVLIHVYGGVTLDLPVGQLPARTQCSVTTWSAYQTNINCTNYPSVEIHRGYVTLGASGEHQVYMSLSCEAKWKWSRCSAINPGFYFARLDKTKLFVLTDDGGKPKEVGFSVQL